MLIRKKYYIYLVITIFIISVAIFLLIYPLYSKTPIDVLEKEYNQGTMFSSDKDSTIPEGFDLIRKRNQYELVLSKFDLFKPKYTLVYSFYDSSVKDQYNADIINYERIGLFEFKITSFQNIDINNKTFEEAVEIATKYDLSKENPDPENIKVYPPPTPEELEKAKRKVPREIEETFTSELEKCYNLPITTTEEKQIKEDCLDTAINIYDKKVKEIEN